MKTSIVLLCAIFVPTIALAGNLNPVGPPASTMKTLDEVEPRIPIQSLSGDVNYEYIISSSGSYYLTSEVNTSKSGIKIDADDVTIDLMGYKLKGIAPGSNYGIYITGQNNEIRNGTIGNFSYGMYTNTSCKDLRVIGIRAISNSLRGIYLHGDGHLVKDCMVNSNGDSAATVVYGIYTYSNSIITGNTVSNNGISATGNVYGIYANTGCKVVGNTIINNQEIGLQVTNKARIINNSIIDNGGEGLKITGSGSYVADNIVKGNGSNYGIVADNQLNILLCEIPEIIDWPAKVKVAGSLKGLSGQNGITVNADNVTIDLAGHTLEGVSDTGSGVYMDGRSNVKISNGTIRDFEYGIYDISGLGKNHSFIDVQAISNGVRGISLYDSNNLHVKNCTASDNGHSATAAVYGIYIGANSIVTGCTANNNGKSASNSVYGISVGDGSVVTGNTACDNGHETTGGNVYGIYASSSKVTGNTANNNGYNTTSGWDVCGIGAGGGCTIANNTTNFNGIGATSIGSYVYGLNAGSGSTVIGNTSYHNGDSVEGTVWGIRLLGYNLVDQNTAYQNGLGAGSATNMDTTISSCVYGKNVAP